MNARADRFPLFDGLRAIAALAVLAHHVTFGGYNRLPDPVRPLLAHGDVGVTIFFVISGFLLYRPFVKARLLGDPLPRVRAYAWRRFLRIVPAYWVALTVVALWLGLPHVFTASGVPTYYGFAQAYSTGTFAGGIGQAWTLGVEVTFYALLPLWALLMCAVGRRRSHRVLAAELGGLALVAAAGTIYLVWAVGHAPTTASPYIRWLPGVVDQFAIGMALAVASAWHDVRGRAPRAAGALARVPSAPWLLAAAAYCGVSSFQGSLLGAQPAQTTYLVQHELYSLTALGIVAPAVLFPAGRGLAGRVLGSRPLLYLGLWSYGIYLYHVAVIAKLAGPVHDVMPAGAGWQTFGLAVAVLAVTTAMAALSYYVVERPALSLKGRVPLVSPAARGEAIAEPAPAGPPSPP